MTVVEGRSEGKRRVTAREAATLLGVHYNTVRNRIKDGSIQAEKVVTEHGPTWMIDPDSLTTNTPPSDSQQLVGRVPQEALTALAREIVREAGLAKDPEREARLEANKVLAEAAKTHILISSGALVGMAAVVGVLPTSNRLYYLWSAVLVLAVSVLWGFAWMIGTALAVAEQGHGGRREGVLAVLAVGLLALGLSTFGLYVFYNIPLRPSEGRFASLARDQLGTFSVIVGVCVIAVWYAVVRILRWRSRRARLNESPENRL